MSVVEWLRVFRAQTYPASLMLILIFYFLGGGELISWYTLYLALFALIAHYFGFGHNSLMDSCRVPRIGAKPYDASDKHKKHHPLVSGEISFDSAHKVIHTGLIATAVIGCILIYFSGGNKFLATVCLFLYMVFGQAYNDGLDKSTVLSFLAISPCFTFFGLFGYFLVAKELSLGAVILAVYVFLLEWFENDIEGGLKEVEAKSEKNIMVALGCRVKGGKLTVPLRAKVYGLGVKVASLCVMPLMLMPDIVSLTIFVVVALPTLMFACKILKSGEYDRDRLLVGFSIEEILSIYLPYFALSPILGYEILTILPIGVIYFAVINRINWGVAYPKV